MMSKEANESLKRDTQHLPFIRQNTIIIFSKISFLGVVPQSSWSVSLSFPTADNVRTLCSALVAASATACCDAVTSVVTCSAVVVTLVFAVCF